MEFEQIYKEYATTIYRLCLGYINDEERAKDLVQDSFITAWQHLDSFKGEADISTWIYKIATNICLRQIEVEKRITTISLPDGLNPAEVNDAAKEEKHKFLRACIAGLPEFERLITGLYLEGVPQEKIAEIMGISHSNVRVKIHRIKEVLVKKFEEHGWL